MHVNGVPIQSQKITVFDSDSWDSFQIKEKKKVLYVEKMGVFWTNSMRKIWNLSVSAVTNYLLPFYILPANYFELIYHTTFSYNVCFNKEKR